MVCSTGACGLLGMVLLVAGCNGDPGVDTSTVLVVDSTMQRAPINELVYSQFIEHQGRCIYGGIWAEMLRDRKFNHDLPRCGGGRTRTPWKRVGPCPRTTLSFEDAYVGLRSPRVEVSSSITGLRQGNLGLVEGRRYTGYVVVATTGDVTLSVALIWGDQADQRQTIRITGSKSGYHRRTFRLTAGASTRVGALEIVGRGSGSFRLGAASLMPADNVRGMRADTLGLLKRLRPPLLRWPGGTFANYYDWRDGVGPRDRRAPRLNLVYGGAVLESNDFGVHEFLALCEELDAQPLIIVKSRLAGDAAEAARLVQYLNGAPASDMGMLRVEHGHSAPYGVRWWGVGNEMWEYMSAEAFVLLHNRVAGSMRAADPRIKIVAAGWEGTRPGSELTYSEKLIKGSGHRMDLISEHTYARNRSEPVAHAASMELAIEGVLNHHKMLRHGKGPGGDSIGVALDEWNYWWTTTGTTPTGKRACGTTSGTPSAPRWGTTRSSITRTSWSWPTPTRSTSTGPSRPPPPTLPWRSPGW